MSGQVRQKIDPASQVGTPTAARDLARRHAGDGRITGTARCPAPAGGQQAVPAAPELTSRPAPGIGAPAPAAHTHAEVRRRRTSGTPRSEVEAGPAGRAGHVSQSRMPVAGPDGAADLVNARRAASTSTSVDRAGPADLRSCRSIATASPGDPRPQQPPPALAAHVNHGPHDTGSRARRQCVGEYRVRHLVEGLPGVDGDRPGCAQAVLQFRQLAA